MAFPSSPSKRSVSRPAENQGRADLPAPSTPCTASTLRTSTGHTTWFGTCILFLHGTVRLRLCRTRSTLLLSIFLSDLAIKPTGVLSAAYNHLNPTFGLGPSLLPIPLSRDTEISGAAGDSIALPAAPSAAAADEFQCPFMEEK